MSDYRNDRSPSLVRLGAAQPPAPWWLRSWFVNVALGFVLGFVIVVPLCVALKLGIENHPLIIPAGFIAFIVASYIVESQVEKHLAGFKANRGWATVGSFITMAIVVPLAITPKCGWNNDKCPPAHQVRHVK